LLFINNHFTGDIVGIKAADIPLQKTSVLLFFIKVSLTSLPTFIMK